VSLLAGSTPLGSGTVNIYSGATLDLNNRTLANTINVFSGGQLLDTGLSTAVYVSGTALFSGTTNGTINIEQRGYGDFLGVVNRAYVTISNGGTATFENTVTEYGTVSVLSGGQATVSGTAEGVFSVSGSASFGSLVTGDIEVNNGGSVAFNGSNVAGSSFNVASGGVASVGSTATIGGLLHVSGSATIAGTVTSDADVVVQAGGRARLVDTAVFQQGNLINNGSLIIDRSNTADLTLNTIISGTGGLTKLGAGTLTLSGSSSYAGATAVNGGVLAYGASNALPDSTAVTVAGGGLDLGSYTDTVASFTITSGSLSGSGTLTAATYTLGGGTLAGNLGAGTMTVTGDSNLNGTADATTVSLDAGTLTLGSASRFTSNQVALTGSSGASVILGGSESVGSLAGGFDVALGSATLTTGNDNTSTAYSGILSGSGGFMKAGNGTFTLAGPNTYSGRTTISGGTLALSGSGSIGTGGLDLGTSGIFDLAALAAGTSTLPATGNLTGAGTISGSGKSLTVLGSLAPGNSAGTITVGTGLSLDLSNSGTSVFEITDPAFTAGTYDLVSGDGSVIFGGTLDLAFSGGSYADGTDVLQIFDNTGGYSGNFSAVNATGLADGQSATFNPTTGFITVVPEPSTYAIAALSSAGLAGMMRWRKRRAAKAAA
jgi:autotransporter-associated beta strand protein